MELDMKYPKLIITLLLFLAVTLSQRALAQTFNPLISFSVESCTLDRALEKLFAEYELLVLVEQVGPAALEIVDGGTHDADALGQLRLGEAGLLARLADIVMKELVHHGQRYVMLTRFRDRKNPTMYGNTLQVY